MTQEKQSQPVDELMKFRQQVAKGLPQDEYELIKDRLVAPGITTKDYVEMCIDFKEIVLKDGKIIFMTAEKEIDIPFQDLIEEIEKDNPNFRVYKEELIRNTIFDNQGEAIVTLSYNSDGSKSAIFHGPYNQTATDIPALKDLITTIISSSDIETNLQ